MLFGCWLLTAKEGKQYVFPIPGTDNNPFAAFKFWIFRWVGPKSSINFTIADRLWFECGTLLKNVCFSLSKTRTFSSFESQPLYCSHYQLNNNLTARDNLYSNLSFILEKPMIWKHFQNVSFLNLYFLFIE